MMDRNAAACRPSQNSFHRLKMRSHANETPKRGRADSVAALCPSAGRTEFCLAEPREHCVLGIFRTSA